MSEDAVIESAADEATQKEAEAAGWIPPARAKALNGKPFIDADEFLTRRAEATERRKEILPVVQAENARLRAQVEELTAGQQRLAATITRAEEAIANMELEASTKTAKAVETAKKEVKAELAKALEAGDHAAVAELTMQAADLANIDTEVPVKKVVEDKKVDPPNPAKDPIFLKWAEDTPWFNTDQRKTRLALVISQELLTAGEPLRGRAFLDKVAAAVEADTAPPKDLDREDSKVDGGRHSDDARRGKRDGYSAMPADARKQCDADEANFVGKGKKFSDQAAYRAHWAGVYNGM